MKDRILNDEYKSFLMSPDEAASFIENGSVIGIGGYTSAGYPKKIVRALAKRKEVGNTDFQIEVVTGANVSPIDRILSENNLVTKRSPMIQGKKMSSMVNANLVDYCEQQMNKMPRLLSTGAFGHIKTAIVEAIGITKEGYIIPSSSIGMVPNLIDAAEKVFIEVNTKQPYNLSKFHDIYRPKKGKIIPLEQVTQKIGKPYLEVDKNKILGIVYSDEMDEINPAGKSTTTNRKIAENLLNFLELEYKHCGFKLPPIQTGFGNLATDVVASFAESNFKDLEFVCGILQEANIELLINGKAIGASCGSIHMTDKVIRAVESGVLDNILILRNGEITNNAEIIGRFAPITLNSGIELDIYGNLNSSHISGNRIVNGLGGGANFAENAGLSIVILASTGKDGNISNIVPMVSHQDIMEHDVDVIVTENGVADLRGKSDRHRALDIINNCTDLYKKDLMNYFRNAEKKGGHHPIDFETCFSFHKNFQENGTMRIRK